VQVDKAGFERELQSQKKRSREALKSIDLTAGRLLGELAGQLGTSDFIGYEHGSLRAEASVLAILKEGKTVDSASAGTSPNRTVRCNCGKTFRQGSLYVPLCPFSLMADEVVVHLR